MLSLQAFACVKPDIIWAKSTSRSHSTKLTEWIFGAEFLVKKDFVQSTSGSIKECLGDSPWFGNLTWGPNHLAFRVLLLRWDIQLIQWPSSDNCQCSLVPAPLPLHLIETRLARDQSKRSHAMTTWVMDVLDQTSFAPPRLKKITSR